MPEERQPFDEEHRVFVVAMLQRMPESINRPLLTDASVRADLHLPVEDSLEIFGQRFEWTALLSALRDVADGKQVALISVNGKITVDRSWLERDGSAILVASDLKARFANAGLLSKDETTRLRTLNALVNAEDLSFVEEAELRALIDVGPLEEEEFIALENLIESTPKAIYRRLNADASKGVSYDMLVPEEARLFQSLLGMSPPETLDKYRDKWLKLAASLDPDKRARQIALAAPICALKGNLVVTASKNLDRSVRLRLAQFLAAAPDPLSQVAAFQLAASEHADSDFRDIGDKVLPILLDRADERTNASLSFLTSALILTRSVSARRQTLYGWPVYAKRLACLIHASLLVRTFGTEAIDVEDIARDVGRPLASNYRLAELCDARTAPDGLWSPPSSERVHSMIVSRLAETLADIPEEERPIEWTKDVDEAVGQISAGPEALVYMSPGPFDLFDEDSSGRIELSAETLHEMIEQMEAKSDEQRTLSGLLNLVVAFDVNSERRADLAALFCDFVNSLPDETFAAGADLSLQLTARWKLADVAERLINLSVPRLSAGAVKDLSTVLRFSLLGAASNEDANIWARKVGEYMKGFAFAVPPDPEVRNLITGIELVGNFAPALQPALTSARSFALMAYDQLPESSNSTMSRPNGEDI